MQDDTDSDELCVDTHPELSRLVQEAIPGFSHECT